MAQLALINDPANAQDENTRAVVAQVEATPALVLQDEAIAETFYAAVKAESMAVDPDVSTEAARDRIRTAARKVVRTKTAIDTARKEMTEEYRRKTNEINAVGKELVDRFATLAAEVRAPLTAWEEAEKARVAQADAILDDIRASAMVEHGETSADVDARQIRIASIEITEALFGVRLEMAVDMRNDTVARLKQAAATLKKAEDDAAELARLREQMERERTEREERDRQEREAKEAAERERIAAEQEAARRKAEQDRIEREREQAAEKARIAAEQEHQAALAAAQAEKQREIDEANKRAADAEAAAKAERDRAEAERQAKLAAEQEAERQRRALEADEQHRKAVLAKVEAALVEQGADPAAAAKIALAIKAGVIPHVQMVL